MKIHCLFDQMVKIKELKAHPKNRNVHSKEQIERLAKIIEYQGFRYPIKVSKLSGFITSGHGRLEAAKKLKLKEVPVNFQSYDSEEQEYADVQSDNSIASWAELDLSGINSDIGDLGPDFDIDLLGIKDFVLEPAEKIPQCDEDEVPEHVEPKTKLGDIYKIGDHRLMCGDCVDITAVDKLMNGEKADLTFTSPPYNLGKFEVSGPKATNPGRKEKYLNLKDDLTPEKYEGLIFDVVSTYLMLSDSVLINVGLMEGNKRPVMKVINRHLDHFKETLYWKKSTSTPHIQPGIVTSLVEPIFAFGLHGSRQFKNANFKGNCNNVIDGYNASGNEFAKIHAATFPVYLPEWIIENFSRGSVIDPFGGSGTTLIACEKTNRKCFMMELDPHYCDVIVARWEKYTGKTAELLNG